MQAKLDELIRAVEGVHNSTIKLEDLDAEDMEEVRDSYAKLARKGAKKTRRRRRSRCLVAKSAEMIIAARSR